MNTASPILDAVPNDWRRLDLTDGGRSLIEASAGTGKTWTIAVLYLRLLLERQLSPRQIVVATFTDAAAQELRERLRGKLQWAALRAATADDADADAGADEQWLQARWQQGADSRLDDLHALRLALAELDVAPISTLHGLCRRILADQPFACGVPFVLGDMIASDALLDEVSGDLWRRLQQGDGTDELALLQQAVAADLTLEKLKKRLKLCLAPGVTVAAKSEAAMDEILPKAWSARLRKIADDDAAFTKTCPLRGYWRELADLIDDHAKLPARRADTALSKATKLTGVAAAMKNDAELIAAAEFSERVAPFIEYLREHRQRVFWHDMTALARQAMETRLRARHQLTFDELVTRVSAALAQESTTTERPLADALFQAWPLALVDEFQDTDGLQYGILDAIYRDAAGEKRGRLVMIGDPKQAIYRFRGGDIHAYQRAADAVDAGGRLTLNRNFRSSPELVAALNQFYELSGCTLSTQDTHTIAYEPVDSSDRRATSPYMIDGAVCQTPLVLHYQAEVPDAQPQRRSDALDVCANQIAQMLQSGHHYIGDQALLPSDIAVLLPASNDINYLRDALRERGVPCVTSTRTSVFSTDTARQLQVVLYAVVHHTDLGALRAAAATRLWGARFSQLQQWGDDVASWQPVAATFLAWNKGWAERGIQYVVEALIEQLATRYLGSMAGERVLTDLRHLGELLQQQGEVLVGSEQLLAWFNERRESNAGSGDEAADAAQLRIESDAARVRLMTLHASKGLEFPIVFLPLMWNHHEFPGSGMYVVNDAETGQRSVEVSADAKQREALDLQDERFRVLYVALTRAIYACHVYALPPDRSARKGGGRAEGTACSALDVMLERMQPSLLADEWSAQASNIQRVSGWQPIESCRFIAAEAEGSDERHARPVPARPEGPLEAKHSFTTLTQGEHRDAVNPGAAAGDESDSDNAQADSGAEHQRAAELVALDAASLQPHPDLLALAAVRGADFGNAVHAALEHRVINVLMTEQHDLIEHWLDDAGVRRKDIEQSALIKTLASRLQGALQAPLGLLGDPAFCLADLAEQDLRAEMGFYFSLERVSMKRLREVCAAYGEPDLVPASTRILSGLMNGKIDLTFQRDGRFHVLDYKGNYLGDTLADYQGAALLEKMDASHYRFQALLYTVAVDRYLKQRLGETYQRQQHLGECVYLFIRAAGLGANAGIWRHRFADDLLEAVAAVFAHGLTTQEAA
ncbi:MAG: UvrD-helicase domain-containing protein [Rhodanobacter sp.]